MMIRYALRCIEGHSFQSWFQSADAFEKLSRAGQLSCPECGSDTIEKALMAPRVGQSEPQSDAKLAKLREEIETNADYVGTDFAREARAMHDGEAPARSIYGEAAPTEAKKLIDEGVPVAPLPFIPKARTN